MVGLQGKKTHVMVLWCATDTCDDIAEYFYTCAMNINRWKCSRAAFVGFHTCDPAAKRSTSRAWCHDSTFRGCINSGGRCLAHQGAREVTNTVGDLPRPTRGWESISWIYAPPKRRITTSASTTVEAVERTTNRVCKKKIFQKPDSRPFKLHSPRIHICGRYWPMGCCFLVGSRFYRRFKRWYKGLKSRVVQVKYEEKGVTLLWI
jgi:hypothetical protein